MRLIPVPDGLAGERVDIALTRLLGLSRSKAAQLVDAGLVEVDGRAVGKGDRVGAGQLLQVDQKQENTQVQGSHSTDRRQTPHQIETHPVMAPHRITRGKENDKDLHQLGGLQGEGPNGDRAHRAVTDKLAAPKEFEHGHRE